MKTSSWSFHWFESSSSAFASPIHVSCHCCMLFHHSDLDQPRKKHTLYRLHSSFTTCLWKTSSLNHSCIQLLVMKKRFEFRVLKLPFTPPAVFLTRRGDLTQWLFTTGDWRTMGPHLGTWIRILRKNNTWRSSILPTSISSCCFMLLIVSHNLLGQRHAGGEGSFYIFYLKVVKIDWCKNLNSKKSENVCSCWSCDFFSLPSLCNEKSTNLTPPCSNLRRLNLIVKTPWGSKEVSPDRARNGVFGTVPWWNHSLSSPVIPFKMGVSKNRGTPKWMVYNRKPY